MTLPTFFKNDETKEMFLTGQPIPMSKYSVRNCILYRVDSIQPMFCEVTNEPYSVVYSGGIAFPTPLTADKVDQLVARETWLLVSN